MKNLKLNDVYFNVDFIAYEMRENEGSKVYAAEIQHCGRKAGYAVLKEIDGITKVVWSHSSRKPSFEFTYA